MARILLVDDEKVARALYGDYLKGAGHDVTAVSGLAEARDALATDRFDVVVTDLILPQGDGMEVLQHTKDHHPGIEVIVITALDKVDPAVRAIKSGAAEYLVKPVAPEALQHAISRALTARQLLRENASLRQYVTLLETGQRIATTLDREKLLATAGGAFAQVCGASGMLLLTTAGSELKLDGAYQVAPEAVDALSPPMLARLSGRQSLLKFDHVGEPYRSALAVPASPDDETVLGWAVLLSERPLSDDAVTSATYLARHLGMALKNLGRFAEVEDLAYLDDLTHLFNVRYLELVLDREVKGASQTQIPFSLLFLDLDYFKSINDTHGHLIGSKLLVEVARVLKGLVRDNDVVVRYGGDEYVVLLRATDSGGALKVGERIRRTMEMHQFLAREGYALSVTTCIGVASFPEHAQDKTTLLDFADRAMYRGKKSTRNVIYVAAKDLEATPPTRHGTKPQ
ncbi:MAG: diguanylate cyclase [Myxococcaceae bacterium]